MLNRHECNSESGHELDIHAVNRSRTQVLSDALLGHGKPESGLGHLELGDETVNIEITTGREFNELTLLPGQAISGHGGK